MRLMDAWRGSRRFQSLPAEARGIVFYSEGSFSWPHLEPVILSLLKDHGQSICYLASDRNDPGLKLDDGRVSGFFVGDQVTRTMLFRTLQAEVLVMTTPDLQTLQLKRSVYPVSYVYIHHSIVSSHMVYRQEAFDHFDEIFCAGPHHVEEIRAAEALHGLPEKRLFEHGYGRLDRIIAGRAQGLQRTRGPDDPISVLVAPSWGPDGLLETLGDEVVGALIDAGLAVTVRPHPETKRRSANTLKEIRSRFGSHERFVYDDNISSAESLLGADIMVSDWSGAALDFAFSQERPVVFVDVPRKVRNPDYHRLGLEPVEVSVRAELGAVVSPDQLGEIGAVIRRLATDANEVAVARIRTARDRLVFNVGRSGSVGAARLMELLSSRRDQQNEAVAVDDLRRQQTV